MDTADFVYDLPDSAIAQVPAEPRDSARLMVTATMEDRHFSDLPHLLDPGDLVVVNRTRVRAARLLGHKEGTGGRVELLLLDRDGDQWEALVRPARRLRAGTVVEAGGLRATLLGDPDHGVARIAFDRPAAEVEDRLAEVGEMPLPPYFHGTLDHPDRYQTIFAKTPGSAAAPTAGLHFTPAVVQGLAARGVDLTAVELSVGLDTFRPIGTARVEDHRMHTERYLVPEEAAEAVAATRRRGGRIVAVGTTVVRTLETAAAGDGTVVAGGGESGLFITPGYDFRVVDRLVTNFHVPGSTLMVLIAAFMGPGWRDAYAEALARGYRFLSFGDAMLADRP